jgi:hypothetical protein
MGFYEGAQIQVRRWSCFPLINWILKEVELIGWQRRMGAPAAGGKQSNLPLTAL